MNFAKCIHLYNYFQNEEIIYFYHYKISYVFSIYHHTCGIRQPPTYLSHYKLDLPILHYPTNKVILICVFCVWLPSHSIFFWETTIFLCVSVSLSIILLYSCIRVFMCVCVCICYNSPTDMLVDIVWVVFSFVLLLIKLLWIFV